MTMAVLVLQTTWIIKDPTCGLRSYVQMGVSYSRLLQVLLGRYRKKLDID